MWPKMTSLITHSQNQNELKEISIGRGESSMMASLQGMSVAWDSVAWDLPWENGSAGGSGSFIHPDQLPHTLGSSPLSCSRWLPPAAPCTVEVAGWGPALGDFSPKGQVRCAPVPCLHPPCSTSGYFISFPPQLGVQSLILPKTWIWCFCCSWISSTALHCLQVTPWLNPPQWYAFYPSIFISPQIIQLSRYWVLAWLASPS